MDDRSCFFLAPAESGETGGCGMACCPTVSAGVFGGLAEFPDSLDPHPKRMISNRGKNFFIFWVFNSKFSGLIFASPGGFVV
jgi:hypothetical protein